MNHRIAFFLLLTVSFLAPTLFTPTLRAQLVPRTVLVEEGTNWSCPPCAAYNPGLETFLDQHEGSVIHLAYHPNFPGADDPMYLNDPADNTNRVQGYYAINGVPAVTFNGCATFNPGQVPLLESTFDSCSTILSPVALTVTRSVNGSTVSVHVAVHPVATLSSYTKLYLRVAAVESSVPGPGPNGEKKYVHVMRTMMPNYTGTKVRLGSADTSFDFSYDNSSYNAANMYEVAFLQNDADHNVLQAATDQPEILLTPQAGAVLVQRSTSSSADFPFSLSSTFPGAISATVRFFPTSHTVWPITVNGADLSTAQPVALSAGGTQPLDIAVTIGSGTYMSGIVSVSSVVSGETLVSSYPIKVISSSATVAFVDVASDSVRSSYTQATLDQLSLPYVPLTSNEAASIDGWSATTFPEMVIAGNKWIITGNDKARVSQYLQSGGHLFVTGGEIAFGLADAQSSATDRDVNFLKNTLRATYVKDSAGPHSVHGVANDPISNSFAASNINIYAVQVDQTNGSLNQPDEIKPANGSVPIFYYGSGTAQCGGVRWDSAGSKLAYLAFGLQNLSATDRASITTAIFNWFQSSSAVAGTPDALFSMGPNYPNPFSNSTWLTYDLAQDGPVRISIVDARGTEVAVAVDQFERVGSHALNLDMKGLAPGAYFAVLRTSDGSRIRAITKE